MGAFVAWLRQQRNSTRLAFLLQMASRCASAVLALVWTPLLLDAMGKQLNGTWLNFQVIALLGGLSDFGLGGAVAVRAGRLLGQKDETGLTDLLATARALFLTMALLVTGAFLVCSPWLHEWLRFRPVPGSGSFALLFAAGAAGFLPLILGSYLGALNYACGNLTWTILPAFLLTQASLAGHWLLARQHAPLWLQYLPYLATSVVSLAVMWLLVRASHPELARARPLRFCWKDWVTLGQQSFWIYFWSLGAFIYLAVDRLLINAGFDAGIIPTYHNNYKVCELALFMIAATSFVSMPKITRWLAANESTERSRGVEELFRLNRVQIFCTLAAALIYLALNDWFIGWWIGPEFHAALPWQFAFALNLAITGCADAAMQVAPRCAENGMRAVGLRAIAAGLVNLALSLIATKLGSILGIALATVVAQSFFSLWISRYICRQLQLSWRQWVWRSWLAPVGFVTLAFVARMALPMQSWNIALLAGIYGILILGMATLVKITPSFVRAEWALLRSILKFKP